ncbi:MAG TPA: hypothetical protein VFT46_11000 [Holophagaceae bacterium]|nr:hypothetical protein [Holophagaceae bacterium]
MLSFDRARLAADYLRARAEVRRASLGTPIALLAAVLLAWKARGDGSWILHVAAILIALAGPWLLRALPVPGSLTVYTSELAAFPLNGLLLGALAWLEGLALPRVEIEGVPWARWLLPGLLMLVPLGYLLSGIADWLRRLRQRAWILEILAVPPVDAYLQEPSGLVSAALAMPPRRDDPWAQFRTVPASARNLRLFFSLDTSRHGLWRVAFSDGYALVLFQDGTGCEAVAPGGISLAVDDAARPGQRERMILVRWNGHLHEGRILPDDLLKIQAWNSRSTGFEPRSTVPTPGF